MIHVKTTWKNAEFIHTPQCHFSSFILSMMSQATCLRGESPNPLRFGLKGGYLHMKMTCFQAASKWVRGFPSQAGRL